MFGVIPGITDIPILQIGKLRLREKKRLAKVSHGGLPLEVQQLRLHLPMQWVQVQSLVTELKSHMPRGQKNQKNIKQKRYCNKFNKDF